MNDGSIGCNKIVNDISNKIVTKAAFICKDDFHRLMSIDKSWPPKIVKLGNNKAIKPKE